LQISQERRWELMGAMLILRGFSLMAFIRRRLG